MNRLICALLSLVAMAGSAMADRPIFLVTPSGVYQSIVDKSGKPGKWEPIAADVIVSGFTNQPNPTPAPDPPTQDPAVLAIATLSKTDLKDKDDATAVAALIDSIAKLNLSQQDFKESLEMAAPIIDSSLGASNRITNWTKKALLITTDPKKLKAGLADAWGVEQATLDEIHAAATEPTEANTAKAVNWAQLITIIQTILTLLQNLGIGA